MQATARLKSISTLIKVPMGCAVALSLAATSAAQPCGEWVGYPSVDGGTVLTMVEYQGGIVIGGNFQEVGGVPAIGVARWDGMSWQPMGQGVWEVRDFEVVDGHLFVAGLSWVYRWDESQGSWVAMSNGWTQSWASALAVHDGSLYAGNDSGHVYRWDGPLAEAGAGAWTQIANMNNRVRALYVHDGDLIAGGSFTEPFNRVARWDGNDWHALGGGLASEVYDIITFEGKLIAAMTNTIDGSSVHQFNGMNWAPVGVGASSQARALAIYAGDLIKASSQGTGGVQRFDGVTWQDVQPTSAFNTWSLLVMGDRLIAGRNSVPRVQFYEDCAGACCVNGACLSLNFDQCAAVGGFFHGTATSCGDAECDGPEPDTCPADLTGDGNVGVADLLQLLSQWGPCP